MSQTAAGDEPAQDETTPRSINNGDGAISTSAKSVRDRLPKNDPREVFGWKVYDWANSAFSTTVAGVFLGEYTTRLAQKAVGENGAILSLGGANLITAKSFFPFCVGASVFLQVFFLPMLGSLAD
jgi:UMF1 family MFS transporter